MHGICFDFPLQDWFDFKVPRTTISPDFIRNAINEGGFEMPSPGAKIYWLGGYVALRYFTKTKKNKTFEMAELTFFNKKENLIIQLKQDEGKWLYEQIPGISVTNDQQPSFGELAKSFEEQTTGDFVLFWNSTVMSNLRENGLVVL
jgi:hypothetical protein